jgi:two-component system, sensor histidine kinase RpfC
VNLISALRARLKARTDSEHEQAILRIVIMSVVLLFMGLTHSPASEGGYPPERLLVFGLAAYLALAIGLFVGTCVWPALNISRRVIGMVADVAIATFVMFLVGEAGVSMIAVYLFLTFGNAFRYGRSYLFACQALCILGFSAVLVSAPYWQHHQTAGWSLMTPLVVLPLYVATLLKRLQIGKESAERALKECLEREQQRR